MMGKILAGASLGFFTLAISTLGYAQSDVIEKRQKLMKSQSAASKAIKAAVEAKDYSTVETKAKDIMGTADQIVSLFPKGSETGDTRAKAAIWEKHDVFAKDAKDLNKAASELAAAAKARNDSEVNVKLKALGSACSSCHKQFREKKGE